MAQPPRPPPRPGATKNDSTLAPATGPSSSSSSGAPAVVTSRSLNAGGPPPSASSPRVDNTGSNPAISAPFLNTGSQPILSSTGSNPGISATLLNTGSNPAISAPSLITGGMPPISMPGSSPGSGPLSFGSLEPMEKGPKDPNIGRVFGGKYLIERVLGEGGMGVVYLAKHKAIGKRFAIKLLHPDAIKDHEVVERFKVEAEAASSIGNEHIIDITDFAELEDGSTYFVMEMLDGKPLSKLFEELKRVPTPRLVRIVKQLAQGLGAAHVAGIVHRDLKPDNIYLCKRSGGELDFVKILDFGIAKVGQSTNKLTKAGAIFGTPHYMSPEQASGSPIDHRTDIYALGVILYEGSVGRVPFDADNFMGILTQHMYKAPVPPRAVPECPADLPAGLEVIIMRCLRKKPEERYETMEELEADLDRLARGEVPKAAQDMMALSAGYQSLAQSDRCARDAEADPGGAPHRLAEEGELAALRGDRGRAGGGVDRDDRAHRSEEQRQRRRHRRDVRADSGLETDRQRGGERDDERRRRCDERDGSAGRRAEEPHGAGDVDPRGRDDLGRDEEPRRDAEERRRGDGDEQAPRAQDGRLQGRAPRREGQQRRLGHREAHVVRGRAGVDGEEALGRRH